MITNISYNVLIERFRAFAEGHFLIKGFTHGDPSNVDLLKGVEFPWMHVFPVEVAPQSGSRLYSFIITFADLPRDKETPPEYQREMLSDCIRLAEDLLAEIQNGLTLFGPTVELDGSASIECFINEFSHTLTGVNLSLTLSVPWDWSACDIPADWSVGGSSSGGSGAGLGLILETNGVLNGSQSLLNLQQGTNITLVDNGNGTVTINSTAGGSGTVTSVALTMPSGFVVSGSPITTNGTLAITGAGTSSDYIDGTGAVQPFPAITSGTVTSVGLSIPAPVNPAFSVSGSPVTTSGTITISANGTSSQLIDGTGALQTIPTGLPPTGSAGGDLSGTYPNPNVDRVHGIDFQSGTPSVGDVWLYEGSPAKWQHQQLPAVHVGNDSAVTGSTVKDALNHLNTTKVESNAALTGATATKITYDSKGLVTAGTTLTASDIPSGVDAAKIGTGVVSNTEFGYLDGVTSAIQTQLNAKVDTTRTISTSSPLSGGGDLSADRTLSIADAVADGATKGAAAFTAADFNSASGVISIDYTNGQKASAAQPGFLTAANWSTFNSKADKDSVAFSNFPAATISTGGQTQFFSIMGGVAGNVTEANRQVPMPVAGTLKNLYVRNTTAQPASGTFVITLRKNGVSTAITVTFANADGANVTKSDTTNSVSVVAGDLICLQCVNNATGASMILNNITILLER